LNEEEFGRADLAPWAQGTPRPYPDGVVNVQDLSLLQNIILVGRYPDGTRINGCSYSSLPKQNSEGNAKVTLYIYSSGITAYLNSDLAIRGVQLEFANVGNSPNNMVINTGLGQGYYQWIEQMLRVLLYDRAGSKTIDAGEHMIGDIPFQITRPEDITLDKILIIDINRKELNLTDIEIIYSPPPSIPLDYVLYQNFPNPFNPTTNIRFSIPDKNQVVLKVYDMLGNEIFTLVNEDKFRGIYTIEFNGSNLASGVYFYQLRAGNFVQTKKMMFVK
jgi:hypothetical protein